MARENRLFKTESLPRSLQTILIDEYFSPNPHPVTIKKNIDPSPTNQSCKTPLIPHPSSIFPHPSSLIHLPSSLIPHPSSLFPQPSSIFHHPIIRRTNPTIKNGIIKNASELL
jgi:hypothetical protein